MRLSALRRVIREELTRIDEVSFAKAKTARPLALFHQHVAMAMQDLRELVQQSTDDKMDNAVMKALKLLDDLTCLDWPSGE